MCHKKVEIVTKTCPRSILSPIAFSPPFNIREIKSDYFDGEDIVIGGIVFNHRYDNDDGDDSADTIQYDKKCHLSVVVKVTKYDNNDKNNQYDKNDKNAFSAWSSGSPKASFCCPHMASVIESVVSMPEQLESDFGSLLKAVLFCPILFYFVFDCSILSLSMIDSTDA